MDEDKINKKGKKRTRVVSVRKLDDVSSLCESYLNDQSEQNALEFLLVSSFRFTNQEQSRQYE